MTSPGAKRTLLGLCWLTFCVITSSLTTEDLERLTESFQSHDAAIQDERNLQSNACNSVLASWTSSQVISIAESVIDKTFGTGLEGVVLKAILLPELRFGVQIRKLCASCLDVSSTADSFDTFCGSDQYGFDASHSGLLMIPLSPDEGTSSITLLPGTHKAVIYCHGTSTNSVPTLWWQGLNSNFQTMINVALASTGNVVLLPDYLGYGEASGEIFKGYVVTKAYQTSFVPLWLKTQEILQTESDCGTALADAAAVVGYSEGGYASVAIAEALHKLNVDIIQVDAGGGPFRVSSAAVLKVVENIDLGVYPLDTRHYIALFGAAYSSTYADLANFNANQDLLSSDSRQTLVDLITNSASDDSIRALIPTSDPLSIFDSAIVEFIRNAIAIGDDNPCDAENPIEGFNLLCQALVDNDLTTTLENIAYPVRLCHSSNDVIVDISNLPDLSKNSLLSFIPASGAHATAGTFCILQAMQFYISANFQNYAYSDKHSENGCPTTGTSPPTPSPVSSPPTPTPVTVPPTPNPVTSPPTASPVTSPPTASPVTMPTTSSPVSGSPTTSTPSSLTSPPAPSSVPVRQTRCPPAGSKLKWTQRHCKKKDN